MSALTDELSDCRRVSEPSGLSISLNDPVSSQWALIPHRTSSRSFYDLGMDIKQDRQHANIKNFWWRVI